MDIDLYGSDSLFGEILFENSFDDIMDVMRNRASVFRNKMSNPTLVRVNRNSIINIKLVLALIGGVIVVFILFNPDMAHGKDKFNSLSSRAYRISQNTQDGWGPGFYVKDYRPKKFKKPNVKFYFNNAIRKFVILNIFENWSKGNFSSQKGALQKILETQAKLPTPKLNELKFGPEKYAIFKPSSLPTPRFIKVSSNVFVKEVFLNSLSLLISHSIVTQVILHKGWGTSLFFPKTVNLKEKIYIVREFLKEKLRQKYFNNIYNLLISGLILGGIGEFVRIRNYYTLLRNTRHERRLAIKLLKKLVPTDPIYKNVLNIARKPALFELVLLQHLLNALNEAVYLFLRATEIFDPFHMKFVLLSLGFIFATWHTLSIAINLHDTESVTNIDA